MAKTLTIEQLRRRSEKIYSAGKLLDYRLYGDHKRKKPYVHYERDSYNKVQNFLYKRALFGLSVFDKEDIALMHKDKQKRILKVHKRAQRELTVWKQELINKLSNDLFELFPNSLLAQELIKRPATDPTFKNTFSFKDLGIKKDQVVDKLYKSGILPNNFYELNENKTKAL
jgi:hypothetical protein